MEKSKSRWQNKNTWNQKKRLKPLPLTHFENKGLRCLFSDHSGAAPKSNTPCCSAKDAVTVQWSPRQGAEHLAAVLQNLLEPFNTYKEREKEGRRAHWDTVLLKGQTEGLIRHQLRKCTHHTEALSPHTSIEEHVPHSPSCRASVLCSRNTKTDKKRDTERVRMPGKGYSLHSHSKFAWSTKQFLLGAAVTRTKQAVPAVTVLCAPSEST